MEQGDKYKPTGGAAAAAAAVAYYLELHPK